MHKSFSLFFSLAFIQFSCTFVNTDALFVAAEGIVFLSDRIIFLQMLITIINLGLSLQLIFKFDIPFNNKMSAVFINWYSSIIFVYSNCVLQLIPIKFKNSSFLSLLRQRL